MHNWKDDLENTTSKFLLVGKEGCLVLHYYKTTNSQLQCYFQGLPLFLFQIQVIFNSKRSQALGCRTCCSSFNIYGETNFYFFKFSFLFFFQDSTPCSGSIWFCLSSLCALQQLPCLSSPSPFWIWLLPASLLALLEPHDACASCL